MDSTRLQNLGWNHQTSLRKGLGLAYKHFLSENAQD
jgi:hypothetical protein